MEKIKKNEIKDWGKKFFKNKMICFLSGRKVPNGKW